MKRLRLVKVLVQPVIVVDDGETLTEQPVQPIAVEAADWPTFPTRGLPAAIADLEAKLNAEKSE